MDTFLARLFSSHHYLFILLVFHIGHFGQDFRFTFDVCFMLSFSKHTQCSSVYVEAIFRELSEKKNDRVLSAHKSDEGYF